MPPEKSAPDDPLEWLARARSNLLQAKTVQPSVYLEALCGWAQQAAEKSLKALLLAREGSFPYTHDLARLVGLIEEKEEVPERIRDSARLTDYAVKLAETVVSWVESKLADEPKASSKDE